LVYNEIPVFSVIAEKSPDAFPFSSSSVSSLRALCCPYHRRATAVARAVPLPSSSYLSPQTSAIRCSFALALLFLPSFFCFFELNHRVPWLLPPLFAVGSHVTPGFLKTKLNA
jgi:hypothetical protein